MRLPTPTDYSPHLQKLIEHADVLSEVAQSFLEAYLKIVNIEDKGARVTGSTYPFNCQRGADERVASGRASYILPGEIMIEINRQSVGKVPLNQSLVDEINRANSVEPDEVYSPLNEIVAASLRAHYERANAHPPGSRPYTNY